MTQYYDENSPQGAVNDPGARTLGTTAAISQGGQPFTPPEAVTYGGIHYTEASKQSAFTIATAAMRAFFDPGHMAPLKVAEETQIAEITYAPEIAAKQNPAKMNDAQYRNNLFRTKAPRIASGQQSIATSMRQIAAKGADPLDAGDNAVMAILAGA